MLVVSALTACTQPMYSGIDIAQTDGDVDAEITVDGVRLTHGRVVIIEAQLRSSTEEQFDALNQGWLRSANEDIVQIHPTVYNFGYALIGAGPGRTDLEIVVDDQVQDTRSVTVVEAR
ncbi:MAG: hypothetical protein AAGF11_49470 [Myxococcota bacterium]